MQVVTPESAIPRRLICSGCAHWERAAGAEGDGPGRCGRFAETRPADARPRCNICWEPALRQAAYDVTLVDG